MDDARPIGIFDSGIGGLSVWREIVRQLPHESTVYLADSVHVPYGPRGEAEIRQFCDAITRFLIAQDCKAVVVACNTASAAALKHLRETFPALPILGMEPAVKPAAETTRTQVIGILATPATFQGRLFAATAGRSAYSRGITLINQVCPGLAERIEAGRLDDAETEALLRSWLAPMLAAGADSVVLACSHYPFVLETIRRIVGPGVNVIDPAPAIARHLQRVLREHGLEAPAGESGRHRFYTSGDADACRTALTRLLQFEGEVQTVGWDGGSLRATS
jgi:glutamate racemase